MQDSRRVAISFTAVMEQTENDAHALRAATYALDGLNDVRHLDIKVLGIVPTKKAPLAEVEGSVTAASSETTAPAASGPFSSDAAA